MIDGKILSSIREEKGYTQYTLALRVPCRPETISRAETGNKGVSEDMALKIATALGVPVTRLYHGTDHGRADVAGAVQTGTPGGPVR